ncbi:MAG TPA: response regulator [Bacillota bacterium]|jgi:two-component system chemotaxis response regulator CheY|nr:response regulator [Bacillota bacterium]
MRILIAEDDLASRKFLYKFLSTYGECDITVDGVEAVEAFLMAHEEGAPYRLVCLDIMMPKLDGLKALKAIRDIERERGVDQDGKVRVIMTTALHETDHVFEAFDSGCEAYAAKPINTKKFVEVMGKLGLLNE